MNKDEALSKESAGQQPENLQNEPEEQMLVVNPFKFLMVSGDKLMNYLLITIALLLGLSIYMLFNVPEKQ
mgnify:FL=1